MSNEKRPVNSGVKDSEFIRGTVPMTKAEVRAVTLSKLQLKNSDIVVDLGAGSGSLSIESARLLTEGSVISVERNPSAIAVLKQNRKKFACENMKILEMEAPLGLDQIAYADKVIIGGSGGHLAELINWANRVMPQDGRLVMNMITLENLHIGWETIQGLGFDEVELVQVVVSRGKGVGSVTMMMGENPVYVISGRKGNTNG